MFVTAKNEGYSENEIAMVMNMMMTEMEYQRELQKIARGMAMDMAQGIAQEMAREMAHEEFDKGRTEEKENMIFRFISRGWTNDEILSIYEGDVNAEDIKRIRKEHLLKQS